MAHEHTITDSDIAFVIDPLTRTISNPSGKITLIQFDHNSERFAFSLPRFVEGHDMAESTSVQIHYINIGSNTNTNPGVYDVIDVAPDPENDAMIKFSWLVSSNCTQLVGSLSFAVRFACVNNGTTEYSWGTSAFSGMTVSASILNTEPVFQEHADIIAAWEARIAALENTAGSGGENFGGVTSWNALIDKPFGLRTTKTVAELQMATGNETILSVSNPATVDVGDVMYVTFDGVEYETTVYILRANEVNTMYAVGNGYIRHQPDFEQNYIGTDTMPFLVAFFLNDDKHRLFCYTQNPDAVHTIGVSMPSDPYIATLDAKYLPDISWNKLTDKPFGVVTNYLQKNVTEHEVSASTTSGTVKVSGLGVLTEDRRRYIHEHNAVNLYLNGVLYKSGMVKKFGDSYKIFASDGEEMSGYLRLDRKTGVYEASVDIPPLEEDTIVTVTYEYDAEFTTIDPKFLPDNVAIMPTEEETLSLVMELGLVDPIATVDGEMLTDESGNVLVY